jgi:hypothetical protein
MSEVRTLALSWNLASLRLKRAKETEMRFRKVIADELFPTPTVGTNTVKVTNTASLKLVHSLNYSIDQTLVVKGYEAVAAIDKEAADRLFKLTYSLNEVEYKALSDDARRAFDASGVLTIKDATPSLKLVDPQSEFVE